MQNRLPVQRNQSVPKHEAEIGLRELQKQVTPQLCLGCPGSPDHDEQPWGDKDDPCTDSAGCEQELPRTTKQDIESVGGNEKDREIVHVQSQCNCKSIRPIILPPAFASLTFNSIPQEKPGEKQKQNEPRVIARLLRVINLEGRNRLICCGGVCDGVREKLFDQKIQQPDGNDARRYAEGS